MLSIATWNINSVRLRAEQVVRLLEQEAPDVLCLQETKVDDPMFPHGIVRSLGFKHAVFAGEKSYNGVYVHGIILGSFFQI